MRHLCIVKDFDVCGDDLAITFINTRKLEEKHYFKNAGFLKPFLSSTMKKEILWLSNPTGDPYEWDIVPVSGDDDIDIKFLSNYFFDF